MKISDFSIEHPAIIGIILIALALFGLISFRGMEKDLLANITLPEIAVMTIYPGASPEIVEREVTDPLEEEFSLISGTSRISSESYNGYSLIFITLNWGADIEAKKNDIRDRIDSAASELPAGSSPRLYELGTSSFPVYTTVVESELTGGELARLLDDELVPRFSRLRDVSAVYARGTESPAVRVRLNTRKLETADLTALDVFGAVAAGQAAVPAGDIQAGADLLPLESDGDYRGLEDIRRVPVGFTEFGLPVYLDEVSRISMGQENPEFRVRSGGRRSAALDIMKRDGGNTERIIAQARRLEGIIEEETGGRVRFRTIVDNARTIDLTLGSVGRSAWLGLVLATAILFIFLHNLRAVLIVTLSTPFTVFITFILMRARGMTLNMMTLAGITVAIGMIVDSSIVILENTLRYRVSGLTPKVAASRGAGEVGGAVLASTTTSLCVFIPILFMSGLTGAILKEVSWTLLFSLAAGGITAVVIVPWLSSRLLTEGGGSPSGRFAENFDRLFAGVSTAYSRALTRILDHKIAVMLIAVILIAGSILLFTRLGAEFLTLPDMNEFELTVRLPAGSTLEDAENKMAEIADFVRREVPEAESDLWYAGLEDSGTLVETGDPSTGYGRVRLVRTVHRERSVFEIISMLNRSLPREITDAEITVKNAGIAKQLDYALDGSGFNVELSGPDWNAVLGAAEAVAFIMEAEPLIDRVELGVRADRDIMKLRIDRNTAGRLAVDPRVSGRTLRILFNGEEAGTLSLGGESLPIIVDSDISSNTGSLSFPSASGSSLLAGIRVRNAGGITVPYSAFSSLSREDSTDHIPRTDRLPSLVVAGTPGEPDLAGIRSRLLPLLERAELPPGVSWRITGAADVMGSGFRELAGALAVAVFLVYAVMVIQFERFGQPFIIMGSVPFVLIGVALSLAAFAGRITMMTFFGVIALGGMVVNNAIVLVDFANQRRREGAGVREAVINAARTRLNPIVITTLTTVLGLIPLAFSLGEGSQMYAPLGRVIGGGLITSTLITLGLIPVLYEWLEIRRERRGNRKYSEQSEPRRRYRESAAP